MSSLTLTNVLRSSLSWSPRFARSLPTRSGCAVGLGRDRSVTTLQLSFSTKYFQIKINNGSVVDVDSARRNYPWMARLGPGLSSMEF